MVWWWCTVAALAGPHAEGPSPTALAAAWTEHDDALEAHATHRFAFDAAAWKKLARGEVVKRRERIEGTDRVLGMIWVPADRDTTWLAVMDPHGAVVEGMVYERLSGATPDRWDAYQSIKLPWPLAPRQWVITVENNAALREATGGQVWERTWTLSDRRDATSILDKAVWLPVNEGGWYYVPAEGGTLVCYHVRTVVGGVVPDEAAVRWSFATLTGMLEGVRDRGSWVPTHYVGDHEPVLKPGGEPVPVFATAGGTP